MKPSKLEQQLELVRSTTVTYLGYVQEDEKYLHLTQAALITGELASPAELAFQYFAEKARKNLRSYDVPRTAVEMKTQDEQIDKMLIAYSEMSKIANKGAFGKYTLRRLEKMLGRKPK